MYLLKPCLGAVALAAMVLAASAASASMVSNGIELNGIELNGIELNGIELNGIDPQRPQAASAAESKRSHAAPPGRSATEDGNASVRFNTQSLTLDAVDLPKAD